MRHLLATILLVAATAAQADDPFLALPLDCTMGQDCYINDYFDRDGKVGTIQDYTCNDVTRDNHRGVDFALLNLAALEDDYRVVAAAPGRVLGIRDEMPDIVSTDPNAPNSAGRECGNDVSIDHANGYRTQYCHLELGSITVQAGQQVQAGDTLGMVGLSGATNYPHLHFTLFKDRQRVDPFNPDMSTQCDATSADNDLWLVDLPYQPGGLVRIGLAGEIPKMANVRDDLNAIPEIPADAPVLLVWAHGYTIKAGDILRGSITGPDGVFWSGEKTLDRDRKYASLNYMGRSRRAALWTQGTYTATLELVRDGDVIDDKTITTNVIAPQ